MDQTEVALSRCNHGDYDGFRNAVARKLYDTLSAGPVFRTDAEGLNEAYLDGFTDPNERQHHNCHSCRTFIERFGSLATVDDTGHLKSAVWDEETVPEEYRPSVRDMARIVRRSRITGVFLSSEATWGIPVTGAWSHLHVVPPASVVYKGKALDANQAAAEKSEEFKTVMLALNEYTPAMLDQALAVLRSDAMYRSEKVLGQAEWLYNLRIARDGARGQAKANIVWRAVATAPAGFCHPRASMIATLLEDIGNGMDFDDISRRFASKMHPLRYQRPQEAPNAATIAQAEKLFEQMGAAKSLERRYARLEEVEALWRPKAPIITEEAPRGIFAGIAPKGASATRQIEIPEQVITFDRFCRVVLPEADRIEVKAPSLGGYVSLLTAVYPDAPPILQWDNPERRNPVSQYFYSGGSSAEQYNLVAGQRYPVDAICLLPHQWHGGHDHQGTGFIIIIRGAKDRHFPTGAGSSCIFPETLRSEYHGVRSVIEAYSRKTTPSGIEDATAAGLGFTGNGMVAYSLRVYTSERYSDYRIDRME